MHDCLDNYISWIFIKVTFSYESAWMSFGSPDSAVCVIFQGIVQLSLHIANIHGHAAIQSKC